MTEFGVRVLNAGVEQKSHYLDKRLHTVLYGGGIPAGAIELGMLHEKVVGMEFADPTERDRALAVTSKQYWSLSTEQYFAHAKTAAATDVSEVAPEHVVMLGSYKDVEDPKLAGLAIRTLNSMSSKLLFLHENIANEQQLEEAYLQSARSLRPAGIPKGRAPWRPYTVAPRIPKQRTTDSPRPVAEKGTVYASQNAHQRGPEVVRHKRRSGIVQRLGKLLGRSTVRHY